MTIRDIRELLRDWRALAGLASIISMLGGGGYVGFQHFVQDEVVPIVKEVEDMGHANTSHDGHAPTDRSAYEREIWFHHLHLRRPSRRPCPPIR